VAVGIYMNTSYGVAQIIHVHHENLNVHRMLNAFRRYTKHNAMFYFPRVSEAVKRGSRLAITAVSPVHKATIVFSLTNPMTGWYEIKQQEQYSRGTVQFASKADADFLKNWQAAPLDNFSHTFIVRTRSSNTPAEIWDWLIALSEFSYDSDKQCDALE